MKKILWFDITNVPHVNFLLPIINRYKDDFDYIFTLRDFAETRSLFEKKIGYPYRMIGEHQGGNKLKKLLGTWGRCIEMQKDLPHFDLSVSVGGMPSNIVAKIRHKPTITFDDNEKSANWLYAPFSDWAFWPHVIPCQTLHKQFFRKKGLFQYHGYKEDMYLADYVPDESFLHEIPFKPYVVVRAENMKASYVNGKQTIVPELLIRLKEEGYQVLFLPRYETDRIYAKGFDNIFIPQEAINGLDACYYSDAVLTGAGTMAREAACMGVPAVSFYAGGDLLTVDKSLIAADKMFFSRNVDDIILFLKNAQRHEADLNRCKMVQQEVFAQLDKILARIQ